MEISLTELLPFVWLLTMNTPLVFVIFTFVVFAIGTPPTKISVTDHTSRRISALFNYVVTSMIQLTKVNLSLFHRFTSFQDIFSSRGHFIGFLIRRRSHRHRPHQLANLFLIFGAISSSKPFCFSKEGRNLHWIH